MTPSPPEPSDPTPQPTPETLPPAETVETIESIDSDTLFQGAKIILITHSGETYRLRITSRNRLILQK